MSRPFVGLLQVGLLALLLCVHGGEGRWKDVSDAPLTASYHACPFMMTRYMESGDNNCRDSQFLAWEGKVGQTRNRSTAGSLANLSSILEGRVLVFMGDSLSRQNFIAMACRLMGDHELLASSTDFVTHEVHAAKEPWLRSGDAVFRSPTSGGTFRLRLDPDQHVDGLEAYLGAQCRGLSRRDVLVVNQGAHYSDDARSYGEKVESALRAVGTLKRRDRCPALLVWRETAANHFDDGVWHGAGDCHDRTSSDDRRIKGKGTYPALNERANAAAKENGLAILKVYKDSLKADARAHIGGSVHHDCLHWCLPGVPDLWTFALLVKLRAIDDALRDLDSSLDSSPGLEQKTAPRPPLIRQNASRNVFAAPSPAAPWRRLRALEGGRRSELTSARLDRLTH